MNALTANFRDEVQQTHPGIQFSIVSPGIVKTEFGVRARHGGPDSRQFAQAQTAEEVAGVIAEVIVSRRRDAYTRARCAQACRGLLRGAPELKASAGSSHDAQREFRQSLTQDDRLPHCRPPSSRCGTTDAATGMPRTTWRRTSTDQPAPGFMRTCTGRKATWATPATGMRGPRSRRRRVARRRMGGDCGYVVERLGRNRHLLFVIGYWLFGDWSLVIGY